MASCSTPQWSNSYTPQVKLTVNEVSSTPTEAVLSWKLQYITYGYAASTGSVTKNYTVKIAGVSVKDGVYDINGKKNSSYTIASGTKTITKTSSTQKISFSVSFDFNLTWSGVYGGTKTASGSIDISARTSYTVSYDVTGGSGAPSSQPKWPDEDITLSNVTPIKSGYSFSGWSTVIDGTVEYSAGDTYSDNASVTLYAIWTPIIYVVTYDANGGSGAPSSQTKTHDEPLTISTAIPSRGNYKFAGWGISATATAVVYSAGDSYTSNKDITLYAIWKLTYELPIIDSFSVERCDANRNIIDENDDVEYTSALVEFEWSTYYNVKNVTIEWISAEREVVGFYEVPNMSGTRGSVSVVIGNETLAMDQSYEVRVAISDSGGETLRETTLSGYIFTLDLLNGGKGIAFGKPAELEGTMDVNFEAVFRQPVVFESWVSFGVKPVGSILWQGNWHMHSGQYADLSEAVSAQMHGVVLAWSAFNNTNNTPYDYDWFYTYVPKHHITNHEGTGIGSGLMISSDGSKMGSKYVYLHDMSVVGNDNNTKTSNVNGLTFASNYWVLRYVIGV